MNYRTCPHCGTEGQWRTAGKVLRCMVCDSMIPKVDRNGRPSGMAPNPVQLEEAKAEIRQGWSGANGHTPGTSLREGQKRAVVLVRKGLGYLA